MKIGKKYIIVIDGGERTLTYTARILEENSDYYSVCDKTGIIISISKKHIITFTEVKE